jgi:hypothetical protein
LSLLSIVVFLHVEQSLLRKSDKKQMYELQLKEFNDRSPDAKNRVYTPQGQDALNKLATKLCSSSQDPNCHSVAMDMFQKFCRCPIRAAAETIRTKPNLETKETGAIYGKCIHGVANTHKAIAENSQKRISMEMLRKLLRDISLERTCLETFSFNDMPTFLLYALALMQQKSDKLGRIFFENKLPSNVEFKRNPEKYRSKLIELVNAYLAYLGIREERKATFQRRKPGFYPPRDVNLNEFQQFEQALKRLHSYSVQEAKDCRKRTNKGWYWQSILSCLTKEGMTLPQSSRWESEIWSPLQRFALEKKKRGDEIVAAGLTGAANLGKQLREQDIRRILGGHLVPIEEILPLGMQENLFETS